MFFFAISAIIVTWFNFVQSFNDDDFGRLLCAADEEHMDDMWKACEYVLRDAVDGCMEKCFIEIRNKRGPNTRIDEKYYQFVFCDNALWEEYASCLTLCTQALPVGFDADSNMQDWSSCMVDTVRKMEYAIEHEDDPVKPKKGSGKNKGNKKPQPKKNGGKAGGKSKGSGKGKLTLKLKKN